MNKPYLLKLIDWYLRGPTPSPFLLSALSIVEECVLEKKYDIKRTIEALLPRIRCENRNAYDNVVLYALEKIIVSKPPNVSFLREESYYPLYCLRNYDWFVVKNMVALADSYMHGTPISYTDPTILRAHPAMLQEKAILIYEAAFHYYASPLPTTLPTHPSIALFPEREGKPPTHINTRYLLFLN